MKYKSFITKDFLRLFNNFPNRVKKETRKYYKLWKENPTHPSLHFKRISNNSNIYSVRIGIGWRAIGVNDDNCIIWFWIGSHSEYDTYLNQI